MYQDRSILNYQCVSDTLMWLIN